MIIRLKYTNEHQFPKTGSTAKLQYNALKTIILQCLIETVINVYSYMTSAPEFQF